MKNEIFAAGIGIIIILAFVFLTGSADGAKTTGNVVSAKGEVQIVKLSVENGKYIFNPSQVKKGVPVSIEAGVSKMPGCSKSVVISAFNIRKVFTSDDNTLNFVPDKTGTFNIACSMNMYRGIFEVLENDGSKSAYVDPSSASGPSCGASGGCGCGGR